MKQQVEELISRLASKELTRGCKLRIKNGELYERLYAAMDEVAPIREGSELFQDAGIVEVLQYNDPSPIADTGDYSDELLDVWLEDGPYGCGVFDLVDLCGDLFIEPWEQIEILGHPILIGDVLEKLEEHFAWGYRETSKKALASTTKYEDKTVAKLWRLWKACGGADKSLQEIVADTEWAPEQQPNGQPSHVIGSMILLVPKQKPIRDLFEFLLQLNLAE